jgi:hypothetical protein
MGHGDNTLWIITQAGRSVATFLLPEEIVERKAALSP